jgi:crossover junction endodeoxyribonuclease RuvC
MIILGIDPGNSGAICSLAPGAPNPVLLLPLSSTEREICDFLEKVSNPIPIHAYLERVSASPGAGVSGMFKFGGSYYAMRMALTAFRIPFDLVGPHQWQLALGCARPKGEKKESQTEHKNRTKARAQQLFPDIKITHAIADAILLAEYGRRLRSGELSK